MMVEVTQPGRRVSDLIRELELAHTNESGMVTFTAAESEALYRYITSFDGVQVALKASEIKQAVSAANELVTKLAETWAIADEIVSISDDIEEAKERRAHVPCGATASVCLGNRREPVQKVCGLLKGHDGQHQDGGFSWSIAE
jgi:hypothetical protein